MKDLASQEHLEVWPEKKTNSGCFGFMSFCIIWKFGDYAWQGRLSPAFECQRSLKLKVSTSASWSWFYFNSTMQTNKDKIWKMVLVSKQLWTSLVHVMFPHCVEYKTTSHMFRGVVYTSENLCMCFYTSIVTTLSLDFMAETVDCKQTRQQICNQSIRLDPFLCITEHGSNWKQTSKEHPPSSPHAQLHPQSISSFRFAHHPFWNCNLKTNGKSRSNLRKTNYRSEGEGEWHVSEQAVECTNLQWKQISQSIRQLQSSLSSGNCTFKCSHIYTMSPSKMNVLLVSIPRLGTKEQW